MRNPGVMRRNRVQGRRSVTFASNLVEKAILPDSARQRMIARTWMKSEQSHPVMDSLAGLVRGPHTTKFVVDKNCWHSLILVQLTMCFPSQCAPSIPWRRPPSGRAELVSRRRTGHTLSTMDSDVFKSRQALGAT